MNFYEAVSEANLNAETWLITVADGDFAGEKAMISGGEIVWTSDENGFVISHAEELTAVTESGLRTVDGCRVYSELLGNEKKIVVCGAGHVSMPIISNGKMMGMHVTVIDDRLKFANDAIAQGADVVKFKEFEDALSEIDGDDDTFFVIVTRGHRYDKECLRSIVQKPHAYIGMIGSCRRVKIVKDDLAAEGISRELLDTVYTPIGLDIGAETPAEIAIAIMAEIIEVKNRKKRNFGFPKDVMKMLLSDERDKLTMATIISRQGSAPRGMGTKMLIARDGGIVGTIGGGCVEGSVIAKGRRMLLDKDHKPVIMEVDMSGDAAEDEGMVCGGRVKVLLEVV
ncbi:MAG: XdhC family protein [Mogibacterium sp.]|nr:XdhC family protein [Mogibacterium sp.]